MASKTKKRKSAVRPSSVVVRRNLGPKSVQGPGAGDQGKKGPRVNPYGVYVSGIEKVPIVELKRISISVELVCDPSLGTECWLYGSRVNGPQFGMSGGVSRTSARFSTRQQALYCALAAVRKILNAQRTNQMTSALSRKCAERALKIVEAQRRQITGGSDDLPDDFERTIEARAEGKKGKAEGGRRKADQAKVQKQLKGKRLDALTNTFQRGTSLAPSGFAVPPRFVVVDAGSSPADAPMTAAEGQEFTLLEDVVQRGADTFREVGNALKMIQERRLYRDKHASFEAYLHVRWGMTRGDAYRQIAAATTAEAVAPIAERFGLALTSESHFRPLKNLDVDRITAVFREVARGVPEDSSGMRHVTAAAIADVVKGKAEGGRRKAEENHGGTEDTETGAKPRAKPGETDLTPPEFFARMRDIKHEIDDLVRDYLNAAAFGQLSTSLHRWADLLTDYGRVNASSKRKAG